MRVPIDTRDDRVRVRPSPVNRNFSSFVNPPPATSAVLVHDQGKFTATPKKKKYDIRELISEMERIGIEVKWRGHPEWTERSTSPDIYRAVCRLSRRLSG